MTCYCWEICRTPALAQPPRLTPAPLLSPRRDRRQPRRRHFRQSGGVRRPRQVGSPPFPVSSVVAGFVLAQQLRASGRASRTGRWPQSARVLLFLLLSHGYTRPLSLPLLSQPTVQLLGGCWVGTWLEHFKSPRYLITCQGWDKGRTADLLPRPRFCFSCTTTPSS